MSDDEGWARCTRDESAGRLALEDDVSPPAYRHRLGDAGCLCGVEHPGPHSNGHTNGHTPPPEITYDYRDAAGALVFQVVRRPDKTFRQRRPVPDGWAWNLEGVTRVPYRLPELLESLDTRVYVVEGEKDVDRLRSAGLTATCNPQGAGKWRAEYSEHLRGRDVVVIPDNDDVGRKHAQDVVKSLDGVANSARIIELDGIGDKGDVSDWLNSGHRAEELDQAPPPPPPAVRFRRFTIDDALSATAAGIDWLPCLGHDGIIIRGTSTLLAAGPKVGKTYTSSWMVSEWLGLGIKVLWITEESLMAWGFRLRRLEEAGVDLDLWRGAVEPVNPAAASPSDLLDMAKASTADVVIMDSVRAIAGIMNENDAADVGRAMRPWTEAIVNVGGRTLLAIHYVRKGGGDAGDGVAGSHAFRSEVDTILELVRDKDVETRRTIRGESRIVPISTLVTQLGEDDRVTVLGRPSQVLGRELERLVVETLGGAGRWMTTAELQRAIAPTPALATLKRAVNKLGSQRHIMRQPPVGVDAGRQTVKWSLREQLGFEPDA